MNIGSHFSASMLYLLLQKKKCRNCGKLSHKDILFCWLCGHSFNLRICVSGHKNPSWAQHCRTCGKDRSLMSQPHSSKDLNFVRHPTRRLTYVPGRRRAHYAFGWVVVCLGAAVLCYAVFLITSSL